MESDVVTLQDLFIAKPVEDGEEASAGSTNRLLGPCSAPASSRSSSHKLGENGVHLPPQFFQLEPDRGGNQLRRARRRSAGHRHEARARLRRRPRGRARDRRQHLRRGNARASGSRRSTRRAIRSSPRS